METLYGDTRRTLRVATQLGQQPRQGVSVNPERIIMSEWVHEFWWSFVVFSHNDERLATATSWGCGGLPPRSFLAFSWLVHKFVVTSARIFTVRAFFCIEKKGFPESYSFHINAGRNLEKRLCGLRHWRIGGIWTPRQKAQCKGSVNATKKWKLHFPGRRWNSQNLWGRTASENIHLNPVQSGTRRLIRNSRKFRWTVYSIPSWRRLNPWGWGSEQWFLDDHKRIHLSSSRCTESQTVRAARRNISYFNEVHRR